MWRFLRDVVVLIPLVQFKNAAAKALVQIVWFFAFACASSSSSCVVYDRLCYAVLPNGHSVN